MLMDVLWRNNVKVSGTGERTLVFLHGFGCDQHMWRLVAPAFEDRYRWWCCWTWWGPASRT
jgi:sigma-B regulation protein RsbQ